MARKNQTAVSDEEIIAALMTHGSIAQAAQATGLAQRTLYDRMGNREFKAAYSAAKSDIVRGAVMTLNRSLSEAVDVIRQIMADEKNTPATRLAAAKMIIESAAKFTDRLATADNQTAAMADDPFSFSPGKW